MKIVKTGIFLFLIFAFVQTGSAIIYFGPGTALDCKAGPIVINAPEYYQWDPAAAGTMVGGGLASPCITVDANDVFINCTTAVGRGNIDGQEANVAGIYIAPGRHNITIYNCRILDFFGSNIYINGTGKLAYNITINKTELTYDHPMGKPADDIACVGSSDITLDGVNAITKAAHTASQSGFGDGAGGPAICDAVTVINSNLKENNDFGIYLQGDKHHFLNNNISLNGVDGARMLMSSTFFAYGNNFSDNAAAGLYLEDVRDSTVESNHIRNNSKYGIVIIPNVLPSNERVDILSNDFYSNDYGLVVFSLINSKIEGNDIYASKRDGVQLADFYDSNFTGNLIDGNGESGIRGLAGYLIDNITFSNNTISNNTENGIIIESGTKRLIFNGERFVDNSGYGMRVDGTSGIVLNKTRIYGKISKYFYVEGNSVFDTHDLWLGYNDTVGILWPSMKFDSVETDVTDSNLLIGEDFVSLDASDPLAAELNETARITIAVPGCAALKFYRLDGFPASKDEIITNGTLFVPTMRECTRNLATFSVAGFSGYTANGTTAVPPSPGGGGERKPLSPSAETICPGNTLELTVTSKDHPVSDVMVRFIQYEPYVELLSVKYTDEEGKATFTPPRAAVYHIELKKDGYYYDNPYVLQYEMCEEEVLETRPGEQQQPSAEQPPAEAAEEKPVEPEVQPPALPEEHEEKPAEQPQPQPAPSADEGVPAAEETKGDLCPLPTLLLATAAAAALLSAIYYWFVMRRRK